MIAEAQRRAFFDQMRLWLRDGYALHVFCNNDGERQRFEEIAADYGLKRFGARVEVAPISAGFISSRR